MDAGGTLSKAHVEGRNVVACSNRLACETATGDNQLPKSNHTAGLHFAPSIPDKCPLCVQRLMCRNVVDLAISLRIGQDQTLR
jgi:hypothetical protein